VIKPCIHGIVRIEIDPLMVFDDEDRGRWSERVIRFIGEDGSSISVVADSPNAKLPVVILPNLPVSGGKPCLKLVGPDDIGELQQAGFL
jgi:hypothetical protein